MGKWFTNQSYHSLHLSLTCGRLLLISCCSNISIPCEIGCLGLSGLNLMDCGGDGRGLIGCCRCCCGEVVELELKLVKSYFIEK